VAEVGTDTPYQEIAVLTDVLLLALGAKRSRYYPPYPESSPPILKALRIALIW
jgi:hypothetical protein